MQTYSPYMQCYAFTSCSIAKKKSTGYGNERTYCIIHTRRNYEDTDDVSQLSYSTNCLFYDKNCNFVADVARSFGLCFSNARVEKERET